jgi:hypothetical protein
VSAALWAGQRSALLAADRPEPWSRGPGLGLRRVNASGRPLRDPNRPKSGGRRLLAATGTRHPGSSRRTARASGVRCADERSRTPLPRSSVRRPRRRSRSFSADRVRRFEVRHDAGQRSAVLHLDLCRVLGEVKACQGRPGKGVQFSASVLTVTPLPRPGTVPRPCHIHRATAVNSGQ